jgi:hypothetical protein
MCDWPKIWEYRKKHRPTKEDWDNGSARLMSMRREPAAQYDPYQYDTDATIEALERKCITDGTLILDKPNQKSFYLECPDFVGYCDGVLTKHVFVRWLSCGNFHGWPITKQRLQQKGANV